MTLLDRLLAKVPRHIVWTPLIMLGSIALLCYAVLYAGFWYQNRYSPEYGAFSLLAYNYTDRPIYFYTVATKGAGSRVGSSKEGGGSGVTCCYPLPRDAKTVTVRWTWSYTLEQEKKGYREETHETVVALPDNIKQHQQGYLTTHFLPNNRVLITFSEDRIPDKLLPSEIFP